MTSDEKYIRQHVGAKNPFKAPEGYFDNVAPTVMGHLADYPERKLELQPKTTKAKVVSMVEHFRPLLYVAATLIIAVFTFSVYMQNMSEETNQQLDGPVVEARSGAFPRFRQRRRGAARLRRRHGGVGLGKGSCQGAPCGGEERSVHFRLDGFRRARRRIGVHDARRPAGKAAPRASREDGRCRFRLPGREAPEGRANRKGGYV